uniref:Cytochrome c-553 n=1 Tax=Alexandrium catenella TaxID=2925 RepID=A0A7S1KVJ7_ALECA
MPRSACLLIAASLALYGASCFVAPFATSSAPSGRASVSVSVANAGDVVSATPAATASWSPLALGVALGLLAAVVGGRPALAADLENGEAIFQGNCTACHAGGNNSIVAEKKLRKEALEQYLTGGYNVDAIKNQVTKGKGSMPAFGERLGPDDIDDVANWVYQQADKW